jgi:hypothetical protein
MIYPLFVGLASVWLSQNDQTAARPFGGAECRQAIYRSLPLGSVVSGDPEITGPHGNDVAQIYRLWYSVTDGPQHEFAGWFYQTFDGKYYFQPVSPAVAKGAVLGESMRDISPSHIPLGTWMRNGTELAHRTGSTMAKLLAKNNLLLRSADRQITTELDPCYSHAWDGSTYK